ncbi:hypothetical protein HELRODRAFT_173287 [Helobdella robusta]|uniref:Cilia- and flagella-associated protein 263 n=1 Tax=Helobdella robusta TaxID=6412 RepID=T1F6N0_HELRO|nr:hypothetical protein HELRODRAFT_173287 [Helobdella robusta]ESO03583.1 hypothetical protein HELRODRAFT_173287 [Helobdella robusta]
MKLFADRSKNKILSIENTFLENQLKKVVPATFTASSNSATKLQNAATTTLSTTLPIINESPTNTATLLNTAKQRVSVNFSGIASDSESLSYGPTVIAAAAVTATAAGSLSSNAQFRRRSKSRSSVVERVFKLTTRQMMELLTRECDDLEREMKRESVESERKMDEMKATIDESRDRMKELEKEKELFEKILNASIETTTVKQQQQQQIQEQTGEQQYQQQQRHLPHQQRDVDKTIQRLIKYLDERFEEKTTKAVKIRLHNNALKSKKKKLDMILKQKEEMGESLSTVDFDELIIENRKCVGSIEDKNKEMVEMKLSYSKVNQINEYANDSSIYSSLLSNQNLAGKKEKLNRMIQEMERTNEDLKIRKDLLEKLNKELINIHEDKSLLERENERMKELSQKYKAPAVEDYIRIKAESSKMLKDVKVWERKVGVAEEQKNHNNEKSNNINTVKVEEIK